MGTMEISSYHDTFDVELFLQYDVSLCYLLLTRLLHTVDYPITCKLGK